MGRREGDGELQHPAPQEPALKFNYFRVQKRWCVLLPYQTLRQKPHHSSLAVLIVLWVPSWFGKGTLETSIPPKKSLGEVSQNILYHPAPITERCNSPTWEIISRY